MILNSITAIPTNRKQGYIAITVHPQIKHFNQIAFNQITIQDNGIGIEKKHIPYIFREKFSTKAKANSGIGLFSVQETLKSHHAKIQVNSIVNKGTVFELYFPQEEIKIQKKRTFTLPSNKSESSFKLEKTSTNISTSKPMPINILVYSTNIDEFAPYKQMLNQLNYRVHIQDNSKKAFSYFYKNTSRINLVIAYDSPKAIKTKKKSIQHFINEIKILTPEMKTILISQTPPIARDSDLFDEHLSINTNTLKDLHELSQKMVVYYSEIH